MLKIFHTATLAVLLAGIVAPPLGCTSPDDDRPPTEPALAVGEGGVDANGCRESGMIFAHGVNNPPPLAPALNAAGLAALTANQAGEVARLTSYWSFAWVNGVNARPWANAPLPTFGNVYDNTAVNATMWTGAGQLTTGDVSVVYNRNGGVDGARGVTNAIAAGEMANLILWYYNHGYKRLGIASHSNGVYTIHAGWTQARALIAAAGFTTRPAACDEMEVRFSHVQAAVWGRGAPALIPARDDTAWTVPNPAVAGTFFARLYGVDFYHNRDQRNEGNPAGDAGLVRARCSWERGGGTVVNRADTWSVGTTVGRVGSWPWVTDNQLGVCPAFGGASAWSSWRARFFGSFSCSPHQELIFSRMGLFPWSEAANRALGANMGPPVGATHCRLAGGIGRSRTSVCNERYDCW